jgi:small-conductance mechanosensitive channel
MATPVTPITPVEGDAVSSGSQINWMSLVPTILEKFIAVLEAAVVIVAAIFLMRYIRNKLRKLEVTHEQQRNAINLFEKIANGFLIVVSITLALKIVGIDMTLLVSVAILGLSYGLQDIIKNYVAGILILFKAPFHIGDIVKIRDFTGKVSKMDFQSTMLETFDNRNITITNSDVMTQSIINYSHIQPQTPDPNAIAKAATRRIDFDVTIGYGSDAPKAIKIFEKILKSHPKILRSPRSSVTFKKFSDSGYCFTIKFWVIRPCNLLKVKTDIASKFSQAFDEQNILSPYGRSMEVDNEAGFGAITDPHKQRIQTFYQLPIFASLQPAEAVPGEVPLTPEQAAAEEEGLSPDVIDSDEPE